MTREELINDIARKRKAHDRYYIKLDIKAALFSIAVVTVMWLAIIGAYMLVIR